MTNSETNTSAMTVFPENTPLAMCYVPFQTSVEVFDENTAFEHGTVFPSLCFPFTGKKVGANAE